MAPVESAGFSVREGKREVGTDLRRVRWVLVGQVYAADRLSGVRGVLVAADSIPRKCCRG